MSRAWASLLLVAAAWGCAAPETPPPGAQGSAPESKDLRDPTRVVATTRERTITVADVEQFIGRWDLSGQLAPELSAADRYAEGARRLVAEELLSSGLESEVSEKLPAEALPWAQRRLLYSQHHLQTLPAPPPIDEAELQAHFERMKPRLDRREERLVSHVFLRYRTGEARQETRRRLEEVRRQVLAGRPFDLMAREHSESETRHRDGRLGFIERGRQSADFDQVVFSLEPEVPSEVVSTADGAHIFYVHSILEARDVQLEDVRTLIRRERLLERRLEQLRAAAADLPRPAEWWTVDPERLPALLRGGAGEQKVLRAEGDSMTVADLREHLQPLLGHVTDRADVDRLSGLFFDELVQREILYRDLRRRERAGEQVGPPAQQVEAALRLQRLEQYGRRLMVERLEADPGRLEAYRAQNAMRFSTPLRFRVERLSVPVGAEGSARMAKLEAARAALDAGEMNLRGLARTLGGAVQNLGLLSLPELAAALPGAERFAPRLGPGQHSPPYALDDVLVVFGVIDRVEPEALPLAEVRGRVIEDYLEHHAVEVFREVTDALLAEVEFELKPPGLTDP